MLPPPIPILRWIPWLFFSSLGLIWILAPGIFQANQLAWSLIALLVANVAVWTRARQEIEILGLLPQLAVLMLWCMPALHFWLEVHYPGIMETPMAVDAPVYFNVALPGVLSLCWAYFLPLPILQSSGALRENLHAALARVGSSPLILSVLAGLCLFGYFGASLVLPSWMQFLGAICRSFLYVLVLVAVFQPGLRGRLFWLAGLAAVLMSDLLRTAMFGEVIGVLAILLLYAVFVRQWAVWKIVLAQIVFGLLVYWLLSFKFEYRKMVAGHERLQDKVACLVSSAVHPLSHPVSPKIVDVVVSRLNQGRLMSLVLRYVPSQQAFVQGETIWTAAKGALIPRLFWPDKPKAGGVENIRRFMGVENLNHSINLGVVGEAYVNYDTGIDFVVFLICYVLFFRLLLLFMTQQSNKFPFLLLLLPSLFFMVNFVEKDVAIMLNHVVKQGMILGGVWICDIRFAICDLRFWPWPWGLKQHKEAGNSAQIQNPKSQIQNRKSQIISIITATYNSAATLPDTLASVAAQDYPHIEHIIVDGLSKDATLELARACPHVSRIISEADKGLYDAMNKGIAAAKGDIIGILNSDDFYTHPEVISRVVAQMEALGADLLYADLEYVDPLDTSKVVRNWKSSAYKKNKFLQGWMPPHPTLFVRREVYAQFGVFNLDFRFAADYELMLRMLHKHGVSVCYLPETIVQMRAGGLSNASLRNRWKANREDKRAWLVNALKPRFYTIWMKPLSKIGQYLG